MRRLDDFQIDPRQLHDELAAFRAFLDVPRGTELPHPPGATEHAVRVEDAAYFGVGV